MNTYEGITFSNLVIIEMGVLIISFLILILLEYFNLRQPQKLRRDELVLYSTDSGNHTTVRIVEVFEDLGTAIVEYDGTTAVVKHDRLRRQP